MSTLNNRPEGRKTDRTVTCTSCDTPAQVPAAIFFAALDHLGWEIFDIGGRDCYLCKTCRAYSLFRQLAHCFKEKGPPACFSSVQEVLRDLESAIASRRACFSLSPVGKGGNQ
jgi:hypothetical protein